MKIVFVADARSPIALNWIRYFVERAHDVHVISSYPCSPEVIPGAEISEIAIAFSRLSRVKHNGMTDSLNHQSFLTRVLASLRTGRFSGLSTATRFSLGSLEVLRHVERAHKLIAGLRPDIVHAMRIPFEGILAAKATPPELPLVLSVWGNDFTFFARRYLAIARQTREALGRAHALLSDCQRDIDLAYELGFDNQKRATVLPGGGGVCLDLFYPGKTEIRLRRKWRVPTQGPIVFCPRQFRPKSVRIDTLFESVPLLLGQHPGVTFICVGMAGNPIAERWRSKLPSPESVLLLPDVLHTEMAEIFRLADVMVSPSQHDGTPNTLLEGMASGVFPVAGDIASIREWIVDGLNGLLCDPTSPESLARAVTRALGDEQMRNSAREQNLRLIAERADYNNVMRQAEEFYSDIIERNQGRANESKSSLRTLQ